MSSPSLSETVAARRQAWQHLLKVSTGLLALQWGIGATLAWRPDALSIACGFLVIGVAAAVQSTLFADRLFSAHEARKTLSESRKVATLLGQVFQDARHVLAIRSRSKASLIGMIFVLFALVPVVFTLGSRLGVQMPFMMMVAVVILALAPTPGVMRGSVIAGALALVFAAPKGAPLWVDVCLCLVGGLSILGVSWRQALADDYQRFAGAALRAPLSRTESGLRRGLEFLVIGALAAAILPKPAKWQAPTIGNEADDVGMAGGAPGKDSASMTAPTQQQDSDAEADEQEQSQQGSAATKGAGIGSGRGTGKGERTGTGKGQANAPGHSSNAAAQVGQRSDGERATGSIKVDPATQRQQREPTRQLAWLVGFLIFGIVVFLLLSGRSAKRQRTAAKEGEQRLQVAAKDRRQAAELLQRHINEVATVPVRDRWAIVALYNSLLQQLARVGMPRLAGETPDEMARRLALVWPGTQADQMFVAAIFCRAFYGHQDPATDEFTLYIRALRNLGQQLGHADPA